MFASMEYFRATIVHVLEMFFVDIQMLFGLLLECLLILFSMGCILDHSAVFEEMVNDFWEIFPF